MRVLLCFLTTVLPLVLAQPLNLRKEEDENEVEASVSGEDTLYNELMHLGSAIFGTPDKKTGEAVSTWKESSPLNPEELGEYAEGDILHPTGEGRNGLKATSSRWPKGIIPYEISPYFCEHIITIDNIIRKTLQSNYFNRKSYFIICLFQLPM